MSDLDIYNLADKVKLKQNIFARLDKFGKNANELKKTINFVINRNK